MTTMPPRRPLPVPLSRAADGRWLGGVCTGLARLRGVPVTSIRVAFVLGALVGGLGVLVYLACWLIIPGEGEDSGGPRGVVVFAQACAACAGLITLGGLGALATVFGFGWVVVAAAGAVLAGVLFSWPRLSPSWGLLPLAALALPSLALAAGGVRLSPETANLVRTPVDFSDVPPGGYRSGLGRMLIDLRQTTFPATGTVHLRIRGGVRRTIVALPHSSCVHVVLRYDITPFAARVATLISGEGDNRVDYATLFGDFQSADSGELDNLNTPEPGPTLDIDFTSAGGGLYVRDYPDTVSPEFEPGWPGLPSGLEPRPDTTGTPKKAARYLVTQWRARHRAQLRNQRYVTGRMPGPCDLTQVKR